MQQALTTEDRVGALQGKLRVPRDGKVGFEGESMHALGGMVLGFHRCQWKGKAVHKRHSEADPKSKQGDKDDDHGRHS